MNTLSDSDTIVAIATAPGRGGVGVIRISGPKTQQISEAMVSRTSKTPLKPRYAHFCQVVDDDHNVLDEGIAIWFPGPNSFTGEDVLELQGHGGPVVLDQIVKRALQLGARLARPGEFSERAFLNDKIDLAQAEAIADLIDATSTQAAKSAVQTLKGAFSERINELLEELIHLRMYVEAAIDFPEEEIDFLADEKVLNDLESLKNSVEKVLQSANQGALIREGMNVVLAGKPNAGKSSLLNALAGEERAIVTDIAGTTRDVLKEHIHIDGMPLHVIDTAGLRSSPDLVEQEGIRRAAKAIAEADRVLLVVDDQLEEKNHDLEVIWPESDVKIPEKDKITVIRNKIDQSGSEMGMSALAGFDEVYLSAKTQAGIDLLKDHLKQVMGYSQAGEGQFSARRRHVDALLRAQSFIETGEEQLLASGAGELLAEDLRLAQSCLSEITGAFTPDDLLGRIFSSFCIGK